MPWVTIRTGMMSADGQEQILKEYQCDSTGCPNVAEHVLSVVRELGVTYAVCPEHAALPGRGTKPEAPDART